MTSYPEFLSDQSRHNVYLVELTALHVESGAEVTFYYSSERFSNGSQRYDARVLGGFTFKADAVPPDTVGVLPMTSGGVIRLAQKQGDLDAIFAPGSGYVFEGGSCVRRHGGSYYAGELVFSQYHSDSMEIEQVLCGVSEVEIVLRSVDARFEHELEKRRFMGGRWCHYWDGATEATAAGTNLELEDGLCVEVWLRPDAIGAAQGVTGWDVGDPSPWQLWIDTDGTLVLSDSSGVLAQSTIELRAAAWQHVAMLVAEEEVTFLIYDAQTGDTAREVIDGSFFGRVTLSGAGFYIGSRNGASYFSGLMRELRVWSATSSEDDVEDRRFRQLTDTEKLSVDLAALWEFEDGTGTTLADVNGDDATISGTETWYPCLGGWRDLEGGVLPSVFGLARGIRPLLVTTAPQHVYQFHVGPAESVVGLFEGAGEDIALHGSAYTDLLAFLAATTPAGKYEVLLSSDGSFVRLGSRPSLPLVLDVEGDASGSGYVSTVADIWRRIATTRGIEPLADPGDIDTTAFDDLNTDFPAVVGHYFTEPISVADAGLVFLQSAGALSWTQRSDGVLTVRQIQGGGTASLALTENNVELGSLKPVQVALPISSVTVRYARNFTPHGEAEIAPGAAELPRREFAVKEWRTVTASRSSIRRTYRRAGPLIVDTAIDSREDAVTEAARLLDLFGTKGRSFTLRAVGVALQVDRGDVISLEFGSLDAYRIRVPRFGTAGGLTFQVLGIDEDTEKQSTELVIWRKD